MGKAKRNYAPEPDYAAVEAARRHQTAVLAGLNEQEIRSYFEEQGVDLPDDPKAFWFGICRAVIDSRELSADVKREARTKLRDMGININKPPKSEE